MLPVADDGEHFPCIRGRIETVQEVPALRCPAGKGQHLDLLVSRWYRKERESKC